MITESMKIINIIFCFILFGSICFANNLDLDATTIPANLKKDALAVVRFSNTEFSYKSEKTGVEIHSEAITVLDKNGKDLANFHTYGDKFRELKKFSAKLYDANGKLLRKFKMSDIKTSELNEGLASDGKHYIFNCETPVFPFTIHYEYEVAWKNGILSFPAFVPQNSYKTAVEKATYTLKIPENISIRRKVLNMEDKYSEKKEGGLIEYKWEVENLTAIERESYSLPLRKVIPVMYVYSEKFIYDNVPGTITDWNTLGAWEHTLQNNRDILPLDAKNKIIELTKDAASDREKVKILYDYLGETTRYVSIQLGIGGWQPMPAAEVYKTGFGDCKALTFYLKCMLDVIGIPSNYTGIRMDEKYKTLLEDFPNFNEMNHVILQVPLENDTLWLECTNPTIPFGFVHNDIAGHTALEINKNGGRLCKLPDYPDSLNVELYRAIIDLDENGGAVATTTNEYHIKNYDLMAGFEKQQASKQIDHLRKNINLPNAIVENVKITTDKSPLPVMTIGYDWLTPAYGNKTGNRLFIPVNPFRTSYKWFQKKQRTQDIYIHRGFKDTDNITINIPYGYEVETIPPPVLIQSDFGKFSSMIIPAENTIIVLQTFDFHTGEYSVDEYEKIRDFIEKINTSYAGKIILRKK